MWTDGQGWTPLHVAMLYGLREDAVLLLINFGPEAVMARNNMGWTPLLLALRHGTNTHVIRSLLEADCRSSLIGNHADVTPMLMLWFAYTKNHRYHGGSRDDDSSDAASMMVDLDLSGSLLALWNDMILLLKAASFTDCATCNGRREVVDMESSSPSSPSSLLPHIMGPFNNDWEIWYVLHASIKYMAPTEFIKLAIKMHPEQLQNRDTDGRFPLHIAASAKADQCLIDQLVMSYPDAAMLTDNSSRFPVNLSLECGKTWQSGVQSIFQAAPEVIQILDAGSQLYPFMLAAARTPCERSEDTPARLETVYKLLCANPGLVASMNVPQ